VSHTGHALLKEKIHGSFRIQSMQAYLKFNWLFLKLPEGLRQYILRYRVLLWTLDNLSKFARSE
jgi:hypothetical protein